MSKEYVTGTTKVNLSSSELMLAANAGIFRQVDNIAKGRCPAHGAGENKDWQYHIMGTIGEMVLAKFLGVWWSGKGKFRAPDVGDMDVRSAPYHNRDLMLHPEDDDDKKYWLVTGLNGDHMVHGWIYGQDGKKEEYWADKAKNGRWAYFVHQNVLVKP